MTQRKNVNLANVSHIYIYDIYCEVLKERIATHRHWPILLLLKVSGHRGHIWRRGRRYGHFAAAFLWTGDEVAKCSPGRSLNSPSRRCSAKSFRVTDIEIAKQVEEHSSGVYTPSPGMKLALTYLEEMGYAASESEGTKKSHQPRNGTAYLNENRASVE